MSRDDSLAPGPFILYSLYSNLICSLNYSTSYFVTSANSNFFYNNLLSFLFASETNSFHLSVKPKASSIFSISTFYWYIFNVLNFSVTSPILNSIFIVIFFISYIKLSNFFRSSISFGYTLNYSRYSSISFLIPSNSLIPNAFNTFPCLSIQSFAYPLKLSITFPKYSEIKKAFLSLGYSSNSWI